jgi:hypothetical protein
LKERTPAGRFDPTKRPDRHHRTGRRAPGFVALQDGVMRDWRRIEEAPFEEDLELFVTDVARTIGCVSRAGALRKVG